MRTLKKLSFTLSIIIMFYSYAYSEMRFTLYGFKIGQNINTMKKELGKPDYIHKFEDGFVAYVYKYKGYNVIFETDGTRPDIIFAIQLQGKSNPEGYGIENINLGDTIDKAIKVLGKADNTKHAIDEITHKEMKDTLYYDYNKSGNFSFESTSNIITSIKISYNGIYNTKEDAFTAYDTFIKAVKNKNYYQISKYLTASSIIYWNGKYVIDTSIYSYLQKNKYVNNVFFNVQSGIMSFEKSDLAESALRIMDDGTSGMVFKITKSKINYEILFIKTFEGWVISHIDKLN